MSDLLVHKLIQPISGATVGVLNDLILCWGDRDKELQPRLDQEYTKFSTNINNVDCPFCIQLWTRGIYRR